MAKLYHSPLFGHIRKYLLGSRKDETVFLFVPYVKMQVLEELLDGVQNKVVLITTWEPRDIQLGSSDLALYPFCKRRGMPLYVSDRLHLKVYSVGLVSAMLATGNISRRGLLPDGNYEAATMPERLTSEDRLFFERIRIDARLVDDVMYEHIRKWIDENKMTMPKRIRLKDIIQAPRKDDFLTSALPMTRSIGDLVSGYMRIGAGSAPSDDPETVACVFHDLANYGIETGLSKDGFMRELTSRFFGHPFIHKIDEFIDPEAYFGRIKEWIQCSCTDVPVPSRRELTGNVQVLLEWFVELGNGRYAVDVPGAHSQRIRNIDRMA